MITTTTVKPNGAGPALGADQRGEIELLEAGGVKLARRVKVGK